VGHKESRSEYQAGLTDCCADDDAQARLLGVCSDAQIGKKRARWNKQIPPAQGERGPGAGRIEKSGWTGFRRSRQPQNMGKCLMSTQAGPEGQMSAGGEGREARRENYCGRVIGRILKRAGNRVYAGRGCRGRCGKNGGTKGSSSGDTPEVGAGCARMSGPLGSQRVMATIAGVSVA
jgi:hypothetical protein